MSETLTESTPETTKPAIPVWRFILPPNSKPGACGEVGTRYSAFSNILAYPGAKSGNGYLVSCNGHALGITFLSVAGPQKPIMLPAKEIASNGKETSFEVNGEIRKASGKPGKVKTEVFPIPEQEGRWPNFCVVLPAADSLSQGDYIPLTIDANQLASLAQAISPSGRLTLFVHKPEGKQVTKPVVAVGFTEDQNENFTPHGFGLLMPFDGELDKSRRFYAEHAAEVPNASLAFPQS